MPTLVAAKQDANPKKQTKSNSASNFIRLSIKSNVSPLALARVCRYQWNSRPTVLIVCPITTPIMMSKSEKRPILSNKISDGRFIYSFK